MKQPHRRLNLNDDLAIFYSGGSGGHYLLHWILLYKKHYTNFSTTELKDKFISQLTIEQKSQLRLSMDSYQNIKDSKWPNYEYYLNNFDQFQTSIKLELQQHHSTWGEPTNLPHWFDYQFDHILQNQWIINLIIYYKISGILQIIGNPQNIGPTIQPLYQLCVQVENIKFIFFAMMLTNGRNILEKK